MMFRLRFIGFIFLIATMPLLGCPECRGCHRRCHMAHPRCLIHLVREKQCLDLHHGQKPLTQSTDVDEIRRPKD